MIAPQRYVFRSTWHVDASASDAFDVLYDVPSYPSWWREVKDVAREPGDRYRVRARSLLPYDLVFSIERSKVDRAAGILEASMTGDLDGFSRWTITGTGSRCALLFEEDVHTTKRLMNVLAPIARPAFSWNHSLMMRSGERGLRAFLSGMRFGRSNDG